jgi:glycosyltransferase involved in cell wall biosynthesis
VTVEAFASSKAVITCADSGGPLELVTTEETGLVAAPTPSGLAQAFGRIMDSAALAEKMGSSGRSVADRMSWSEAIKKLMIV